MKKLNSLFFIIAMILLSSIPFQTASAGYVLLKKDNPNPGTEPNYSLAPVRIALDATQNDADVTLNFLYPVGVAQVTVENENGEVVYQEAVDTYSTLDASIDTQNLDGGVYTLKISYGSTDLVGEFEL
jgi:hypothetical protein